MLGIGFLEIIVIALVALVVLGPKHLPSVLRKIALVYKQFQNLRQELKSEIITISHMTDVNEAVTPTPAKVTEQPQAEAKNG